MSNESNMPNDTGSSIVQPHGSLRTAPREKSSGSLLRYSLYGIGAAIVILTIAYVDGGEEPLHPIVQSVSLPTQSEGAL